MEKIMEPFGARLKVLRKAKKLKQSDMALLLDCAQTGTINVWNMDMSTYRPSLF